MATDEGGELHRISSTMDFRQLMYSVRDRRRHLMRLFLRHVQTPCDVEELQKATIDCREFIVNAERSLMNEVHLRDNKQIYREFDVATSTSSNSNNDESVPPHSVRRALSTHMNISDEIGGLRRDVDFLRVLADSLCDVKRALSVDYSRLCHSLLSIDTAIITAATEFIRTLRKPVVITDWDGTLKTYGCQYATCMQDMMSALPIALYAAHCTHVTAVLTSGPLRDHGITDLTCIPPELSNVVFGGSLGRQWWLPHGIIADDSSLSTDDQSLLDKIVDELRKLHAYGDDHGVYEQFAMLGSGVQRKLDRVSIGTQSVAQQVSRDEQSRYVDAIKRLVDRCDPQHRLEVDEAHWDIDIAIKHDNDSALNAPVASSAPNSPTIWDKACGVKFLCSRYPLTLSEHDVLVCGDTMSDTPMVDAVLAANPSRTRVIFVNATDAVRARLDKLYNQRGVDTSTQLLHVPHPAVIHAAFAQIAVEAMRPTEVAHR